MDDDDNNLPHALFVYSDGHRERHPASVGREAWERFVDVEVGRDPWRIDEPRMTARRSVAVFRRFATAYPPDWQGPHQSDHRIDYRNGGTIVFHYTFEGIRS